MSSLFRRPGSPYWFAAYRAADGKRVKKSTKQASKAEAQVVCAQLVEAERLARSKTLTETQARRLILEIVERTTGEALHFHTCRGWLDEWCAAKVGTSADRTIEKYKQVCRDFLEHLGDRADLAIGMISPRDVRSFRDELRRRGLAASSVNQTFRKVLAAPFGAAQRLGYIQTNPCAAVDSLRDENDNSREVFTAAQVGDLYRCADGDWKGVVLAGYYTGLRLRDITELRWESVDLEAGLVRVRTRKNRGIVSVPLHEQLSRWLLSQPKGEGKAPVFPSLVAVSGTGRNGLSMQFGRLTEKAGIPNRVIRPKTKPGGAGRQQNARTFHSLRHSFVSALANAGVAPEIRQKLSGHADAKSHARYTHHELAPLQAAVAKLPSLEL